MGDVVNACPWPVASEHFAFLVVDMALGSVFRYNAPAVRSAGRDCVCCCRQAVLLISFWMAFSYRHFPVAEFFTSLTSAFLSIALLASFWNFDPSRNGWSAISLPGIMRTLSASPDFSVSRQDGGSPYGMW